MKKYLVLFLLSVSMIMGVVACSNGDNQKVDINETNSEENYQGEMETKFMGGLYARSETSDAMIAFFDVDGDPVVVITEFGEYYYGSYNTEYARLADGTEYSKVVIGDTVYGYHFNEDGTGIIVDKEGNKYEAKKLDESVAKDMLKEAQEKQK